eukprot:CAMPEP_0116572668 /NCGR_PEP_ID=MMETSP0397-20121206/18310_1 /TAXON_ID=216820 /ORGANISM="Cyclophora tenuis, Strain ECT3854" /LENGTH=69 /DNA_ID=CAMNT_0004101035 /DNA_START=41 /DNA_END=250 /DNA_ORIENTATION=+
MKLPLPLGFISDDCDDSRGIRWNKPLKHECRKEVGKKLGNSKPGEKDTSQANTDWNVALVATTNMVRSF